MRIRSLPALGAAALLVLSGACAEHPSAPSQGDDELLASFETMAAEAGRDGDVDGAASLSSGSIALRMGVRPSVIEVVIDGVPVRHYALVAGVEHRIGEERVLLRSLIAWTGERHPETVLEVSLIADEGVFGVDRARGVYSNRLRQLRWVATAGGAGIKLAGTGDACGRPLAANPNLDCVKASYDVRVDGEFHRLDRASVVSSTNTRLSIVTAATGVHGVLVTPAQP